MRLVEFRQRCLGIACSWLDFGIIHCLCGVKLLLCGFCLRKVWNNTIESRSTFFIAVVIGLFDKSVLNFDVSGLKQTKWIHCCK